MVAKKVMLVLGVLLIAISCSMALPVFSAPTPSNNTPYGDYQLILNISDDSAMDWCSFEIDGVNQSGTLSDDFLSCWYELPQTSKYVGHNYSVIGYDSVSATEYATDIRNIPYYGCGYINESLTTLQTNVFFNGSWTACFIWTGSSQVLDGNGYWVDGGSADNNVVILADYTDGTTVKNLKIINFATGLACGDTCSNTIYENNTLINTTFNALYMGATTGGIIRNNYVNGFHDTGVSFGNTYNYAIKVYGNTIIGYNQSLYGGDTEYGILLTNFGDDFEFYNNNISNILTDGIYAVCSPSSLTNVRIHNNHISSSYGYGINTNGLTNLTLNNNHLTDNANGIYLANDNDILAGNNIDSSTGIGIMMDNLNFANQYVSINQDVMDGTKFYLTDIQDTGEKYSLSPTTLFSLPLGEVNVGNKKIDFSSISGTPILDYMRMYWSVGDTSGMNETSLTLRIYDTGIWTLLSSQPNTISNVIEVWNVSSYGAMAILGMYLEPPSFDFDAITIDSFESGLTNQVKLHIYAKANDSIISYCDIRTNNYVDEDKYYWSSNPYTAELNRTVVIEKTDDNKIKLYCADINGDVASSNYISVSSSKAFDTWMVWACLLGSVLLLLYAIKSENLFFGIFASLGFLVFVKLSEGAFMTEIESLVPVFFWIKVVFAISLVLLIAQLFLKQAKSEIS